jgi:hypothetical protein
MFEVPLWILNPILFLSFQSSTSSPSSPFSSLLFSMFSSSSSKIPTTLQREVTWFQFSLTNLPHLKHLVWEEPQITRTTLTRMHSSSTISSLLFRSVFPSVLLSLVVFVGTQICLHCMLPLLHTLTLSFFSFLSFLPIPSLGAKDVSFQSYDRQLSILFDNVDKWERKLAADPLWSYLVEQEQVELASINNEDDEEEETMRGLGYGDEEEIRRHNLKKYHSASSDSVTVSIPMKVLNHSLLPSASSSSSSSDSASSSLEKDPEVLKLPLSTPFSFLLILHLFLVLLLPRSSLLLHRAHPFLFFLFSLSRSTDSKEVGQRDRSESTTSCKGNGRKDAKTTGEICGESQTRTPHNSR